MRRVLKILGKIVSVAVLLLIVLPLLLSLLLDITAVQNFVVHKAAQMVSRKLETTVSIDRIDIGLFNKIKVKGFYVEDYQRDTLLYVGRVDAFVTSLGIFGGGLELSRGEIADAKLCLHETPDGEMNIKQIVNRLSNPNKPKKGDFKLKLSKASIENMELCLDQRNQVEPEYGINFAHMHLYNMMARIDDFTIDGSSIYTTIAAISARERSGFVLNHLAGRFYLTSGCLGFENTSIITGQSNISIPYISLVGNSWADYKDFIGEVRIDGALRNTTVSTDDIAYFAPKLRGWHTLFSNINVEIAGVVSDFTGNVKSMQIGDKTFLTAEATIKGLPDIKQTHFDLRIPHLRSSGPAIDRLASSIAGKRLPVKTVQILSNAGNIDVGAHFSGLLSSFDMQVNLASGIGRVSGNLGVKPLRNGRQSIRGDFSTRELRLGQLLGKRDLLGNVTLSTYVDGTVGQNRADINVRGLVTRLGFNGYVYDSLQLDGRLRNKGFDGRITARDPNLDFNFAGEVDLNDSVPRYDFTLDLHRADLAKLHINKRDSVSVLAARISANASGRSLDDLNGRIEVADAHYQYNDKQVASKQMTVTGENSARSKFIELRSDFADATFRSKTSYRKVVEYLKQSAWKYLPLLGRDNMAGVQAETKTAVVDDYSLLSVDIRKFNPVADAISSGLQVADGSSLRLLFNPASDQLSLRVSSEYIERERMLITRLNVNASNQGDSLAVYGSAEDFYAGTIHLPRVSLTGGAKQGRVLVSAGFNDTLTHSSALLGFRAQVVDEHGPNGRVVDLKLLPSHLTRGDKTWQIFAHRILLDTARVVIDKFYMMNRDQELLVDGVVSRNRDDSLTLNLKNFDLAPFSQFSDQIGYSVEGRTNGSATMKSVRRGGEVTADILVDSLAVNGIKGPSLRLTSRWDFAQNRAGITVVNRMKRDTLVRGFYNPAQVRYYARVTLDSLDMGLLNPVLSGIISGTKGLASADLVLQGRHRDAELKGQIRVRDLSTTVDFTQVTYTMPEALLDVQNNLFRASNVPLFDPQGNRGRFDFDLNLKHLSNISYDVRVAPREMLVLNTTSRDNNMFYGKVYASGSARISGDKGHVNMDITASSEENSSFFLPLEGKSDLSYADFVTFVKAPDTDTVNLLDRKKKMFERQRRQKAAAASQMNISLALNVQPTLDFQMSVAGSTVKARGNGSLNMQINPRSNVFEMYGDYTITEGSYDLSLLNLVKKKFIIESGSSIQWTGSPMDAMLNIDALYKLKASLQPLLGEVGSGRSVPVECVIRLRNRLSNPGITFDVVVPAADPETQSVVANALSTPELVNTQFLSLLVFNNFMGENNPIGSNGGAMAATATGLEMLTGMLSNWLSNNDYNIILRYRPKSDVSSDEVNFGLSKSLINNRLLVEVEGNYIIDNKQAVNSSMSNFMGEAYVTYLLDRSGALKVKAFTQTIDRFDENQGLQETGVGIYYKEDFNNFKDLRRRVKDRFTNKKRKAQREARRAAEKAAKQTRVPADSLEAFGTTPE